MRHLFFTIMAASAIVVGCQDEARLTQVKVLDPEFKTVCVITNTAALGELSKIWHDRIVVDPSSVHQFTYKVDVSTGETGVRWLYDPAGYASVLSKARMPVYQFRASDKLRELLIPRQEKRK